MSFGFSLQLAGADAPAAATKPGFNVVVEIIFDEVGVGEEAKIVESDDFSGDMILNQIAINLASQVRHEPKLKDGKPVKFTVRVPFNFPVEGDEGAAANLAPKPALRSAQQPAYPEAMAAKAENGGAILELVIGADGAVRSVTALRSSHPEYAEAALAAVKNWVFAPAKKDEVPVDCRWRIAVSFSADGKDVDWQWRIAPRPSLGNYTVVRPKLLPAAEAALAVPPAPVPGK